MSTTEIISTAATRSPARARRMSQRRAELTLSRIMARSGPRFERRLAEGLGYDFDTGKPLTDSPMVAFAACSSCKRPYVQEWAIREVGALLRAAMGKPEVAMQIVNMIGADVATAQMALGQWQEAKAMPKPALIESCRKMLEAEGWRCLPPEGDATGGNGAASA